MPSIRDLWPDKWLRPDHLGHSRPRVTVASVTLESLFNPRSRQPEPRLIMAFVGKEKRLPLNKTQAVAMMQITLNDDYTTWHGATVILSVGRAPNGSDTITISPVADKDHP